MSGELQPYDTDPLLAQLHARLQTERNALPAASPEEVHRVLRAIASYDRAMSEEFGREHDHFRLLGQDNIRRYLPVGALRVRIHPADSLFDVVARVCAAQAAGCRITVSVPSGDPMSSMASLEAITRTWGDAIEVLEESDTDFADCMVQGQTDRVRFAASDRVSPVIYEAAKQTGQWVAQAPVLMEGRIELLWYLREQSFSHDTHRYGNLGEKGAEGRAPVL